MASQSDPFLQVHEDVLLQIATAQQLYTSYLRIQSHASSRQKSTGGGDGSSSEESPELASTRADLAATLDALQEDLTDLNEAVRVVETNPSQFRLSPSDVSKRWRLVHEASEEVDSLRQKLQTLTSSRQTAVARSYRGDRSDLPPPSSFALADGADYELDGGEEEDYDDEAYRAFAHQQQEQIMREQDEQIHSVSRTVGTLRSQAMSMGREMAEQNEMLTEVNEVVHRVEDGLKGGMKHLNHLLRQNEDTLSSCCIILLIIVLVILLVLLLIL